MNTYDSRRYGLVNRWDPFHLRRIDRLLPLSEEDRVLEIGAGQGHLTRRLAERGVDVTGVDANPNAPAIAKSPRVRHMRAEALEFDDNTFDAIVSVHTIEHIPPLQEAMCEVSRVLKLGGKALFIYPAEPIRGLFAMGSSIILFGTPFRAREVHCHKLSPAKVRQMTAELPLNEVHWEFNILSSPQFISVLEKVDHREVASG